MSGHPERFDQLLQEKLDELDMAAAQQAWLEVDAVEHPIIDEGNEGTDLPPQIVVRRRDQARVHGRRSVGTVRSGRQGDLGRIGRGEGGATTAMAVQVDETR